MVSKNHFPSAEPVKIFERDGVTDASGKSFPAFAKNFSFSCTPFSLCQPFKNSAFIFPISTFAGHSLLQALQLRQRSKASRNCSEAYPFGSSPAKTCLNTLALPRVESFSSFVAM